MKAIEIKKEFEEKFLQAAKISAVQVRKKKLVKSSRKVCYELVYPFSQMDIFKVGYEFARQVQ